MLWQIGSTFVYVVYVGIALKYNAVESKGYFVLWGILRGFFLSTLGYIGITIEYTGSNLEYVASILRLDMLISMAYIAYAVILVNIMSTMG